ncbi:transposase [Paenibacillus agricola]|uniref:Transposase DDE domain-containing protein n=1 Tax=Paenibacillus agricola TaxID=2716264 RepID=A0ABX0J417_9BACL|nr:hypothetical protein [Paenibacillus agricola]
MFDVDSSGFTASGKQKRALYNAHYGQNGLHPLFCFVGLIGDCLKTELRVLDICNLFCYSCINLTTKRGLVQDGLLQF